MKKKAFSWKEFFRFSWIKIILLLPAIFVSVTFLLVPFWFLLILASFFIYGLAGLAGFFLLIAFGPIISIPPYLIFMTFVVCWLESHLFKNRKLLLIYYSFSTLLIGLGMFYLYNTGGPAPTRGIEVIDAFCVEGATDTVNITVRNIGTTTITPSEIIATETRPTAQPVTIDWGATTTLDPGKTVNAMVICDGSGGRMCQYRLTSPIGKTFTAAAFCT